MTKTSTFDCGPKRCAKEISFLINSEFDASTILTDGITSEPLHYETLVA
jgi:hypothetical protein